MGRRVTQLHPNFWIVYATVRWNLPVAAWHVGKGKPSGLWKGRNSVNATVK